MAWKKAKPVTYRILAASAIDSLQALVNFDIGEGWRPLGGVSFSGKAGMYLHAMVKNDD